MNTHPQKITGMKFFQSILLFFGSYLFALVSNSYIIHELAHAFGGIIYGCKLEGLQINPFGTGGWNSICPPDLSMAGRFLQGMGGPIFGLPLSIAITLILWRKRKSILLPFLMSASVVLTLNFIGVLDSVEDYPGFIFDYGWMLHVGVSSKIVWLIGLTSLLLGTVTMNLLIPLAGVGYKEPFWKVLLLHLATLPLFLLIRLIYQFQAGVNISGPLSFLIFGIILATMAALFFKPTIKITSKFMDLDPVTPSDRAVWLAIGLGVGLTGVLTLMNPVWVRVS